jgi:hypothetical protein
MKDDIQMRISSPPVQGRIPRPAHRYQQKATGILPGFLAQHPIRLLTRYYRTRHSRAYFVPDRLQNYEKRKELSVVLQHCSRVRIHLKRHNFRGGATTNICHRDLLEIFFLYIFWGARVCRQLLRLYRPFMIFEGCLDSNPECCRSKLARYRLSHPSLYNLATHPYRLSHPSLLA